MKLLESYSFQFQAQELPHKLHQLAQQPLTGSWLFEFPHLSGTGRLNPWYLTLSDGQVVCCGHQQPCWQLFLTIFERYILGLQNPHVQQALRALEKRFLQQQHKTQSALLLELLNELQQLHSITTEQLRKALRVSILAEFDTYLFHYPGQARFLPSCALDIAAPLLGFELNDLINQAQVRQTGWHQLKTMIPSVETVPVLNREVLNSADLTAQQKLWLETLTSTGKTLNQIACSLAQDPLEVAKIFASLITKGLVNLKSSPMNSAPEIFVVDDSPLILKQFETLVRSWGYSVRSFHTPSTVIETLNHANPAVFFLDINMPEITGFDLVKQIRRQPQLATVPIIMLTAEQTLTNNWRARWSGCQFLSKPLTPHHVPKFKQELRLLLSELLLIEPPSPVEPRFRYQT